MATLLRFVPSAFLSPYSDVLAQIAGIALAAAFAAVFFRRAGTTTYSERAVVVSVLVVGAVAVPNLWTSVAGADAIRASFAPPPGTGYTEKCLTDLSRPDWVQYARWVRTVVPEDVVYSGLGDMCLAFQLLPRLPARPGQDAAWQLYPAGLPPDLVTRAREQQRLPVEQRTVFVMPGSTFGAVRLEGGGG